MFELNKVEVTLILKIHIGIVVHKGLLVNAANVLEPAHIKAVLGATIV
jgi:hypothetical protein